MSRHHHLHHHHSPNPFASLSSHSDSDSDSDSVSCFVTDLFETSSRLCSCDDTDINPFSDAVCDVHRSEHVLGLGLGLGIGVEIDSQTQDNDENNHDRVFNFAVGDGSGGLRVEGFGSESDDSNGEEGGVRDEGGGFDDFDVRLCWDSLCLEDQRTLNEGFEWEEVEERVNGREDSGLVVDEVEIDDVDGDSVGFTNADEEEEEEDGGEEALRYLEWEILLAVNNSERNVNNGGGLEHEGIAGAADLLTIQDGYVYAAEYDVLFGQFLENESALKGSPPAAKSVVESLPLVELSKEELLQGKNLACAICKDEILLEEKVRRLPCSHCYHGDCILPWLEIRNTCPVCRFELPTDDPDYEQRKVHRAAHDLLELATAGMQF
ncbi:hypothetical protein VNO80_13730 [Phaseolus coccineus]|uniref:RING-type E3 ubiquitin transferase n=1 Tax=Phaseolus coccineus TaxID=3886 RepID=A0AAN9N1J6_PHACN